MNPAVVLPVAVLITSLVITERLWRNVSDIAEKISLTDFEFRVRDSNIRIEERIKTYEQVLRGAAGLFAAYDEVSREAFARYVSSLNLEENYPGIQGVGFSKLVAPNNLQQHINEVRKGGFPNYTIRPAGARHVYTTILYLEPFYGANLRAFGYDMFAEPARREAMELARDTGRPAASGKVTLVQESGQDVQAGFLIYLPVYRANKAQETIVDRRNSLIGWVYAAFRMEDLMSGINSTVQEREIEIAIYDGTTVSDEALLYASGPVDLTLPATDRLTAQSWIKIGQRRWTIVTQATPLLERRIDRRKPLLVLQGGAAISILLTLLTWLFLDDRAQAIRVARQAMELALYDPLTRLPNRKLVAERLHQALVTARRRSTRVAVMFVDLDKFKPVNDNFGHAMGDLLLQAVGERLQSCVRSSDTVSRLGGDEFVVLLPEVGETEGAIAVAEKIVHALAQDFVIAGHALQISSSVGIALYPDHGTDEQTILRNADLAMYAAKNSGRNNFKMFDDSSANRTATSA